VGKVL